MKTIQVTLIVLLFGLHGAPQAQAFYHPTTGRWLNRDPVNERGGQNLYVAMNNAAPTMLDPDGRCPDWTISWRTNTPVVLLRSEQACRNRCGTLPEDPMQTVPSCTEFSYSIGTRCCCSAQDRRWYVAVTASARCTIYMANPRLQNVRFVPSPAAAERHERCHCGFYSDLFAALINAMTENAYPTSDDCNKRRGTFLQDFARQFNLINRPHEAHQLQDFNDPDGRCYARGYFTTR